MKNIFSCNKKYWIIIVVFFLSISSYAQKQSGSNGSISCFQNKIHNKNKLSVKSVNSPRHSFDVLKYTLSLDLFKCYSSPYPHSYTANEIINFKIDTALNKIKLNAVNTSLVVDSIGMSGVSFTHSNDTITITLDRIYNHNEVTGVKIYYHHLDISDGAFYTGNG